MVHHPDHPGGVEAGGVSAGVEIAPQGAQVQDAVTALDEFPDFRVHDPPVIDADELRVGLVQGRFIHEHGGEGETRGLHQGQGLGGAPQPGQEIACQDAGGPGRSELRRHGIDRFRQRRRVAGGAGGGLTAVVPSGSGALA